MSHVWFSPVSGAINQMDALRNPNPHRTDGSVIDEPPAARNLAVATASGAPIQRLSEHLLFAIFDFVRDGHAFVQSEASCAAHFAGCCRARRVSGASSGRRVRFGTALICQSPCLMTKIHASRTCSLQNFFSRTAVGELCSSSQLSRAWIFERNTVDYMVAQKLAQVLS